MNKNQVNHIDGNKLNNKLNNLEWCTAKENIEHSIRTGLKPNDRGVNNIFSKFSQKEIEFIRKMYKKGDKEFGCRKLAQKFNVSKSTMSYIINNKTYK